MNINSIFSGTLLIFKKRQKARSLPLKSYFASATVLSRPLRPEGGGGKRNYDSEISLNHFSLELCLEEDSIKPAVFGVNITM